jgi:hypothetical protein
MKKTSSLYLTLFLLVYNSNSALAQSDFDRNIQDVSLKDSLYSVNKNIVINYTMKEFDALNFDFFKDKANPNLLLSKKEFYTYTVKIATFSDRLASLYPAQKQTAAESKKKWLSESYEDYLLYKASQKK